ncbi:MAG TPA: glycosyltransferase [Planctomycetota bacterium]|nr:glycosyltransferase [Planctomycetota bacterium]
MRISVVIPTYNAGADFPVLLQRLREQKPAPPDEIVVIDSGSRDYTCKLARDSGARVIEWKERFNHGVTRDAGIAASTGEIVLLTVQDAQPVGIDWLARITSHFSDPAVAGVSTRQVPPADGPLELKIKAQLEAQEGMTRVSLAQHPDYARYTPAQRLQLYRFDNVCSALRRSVWEKIPFGPCRYAEDLLWARRVLEAGHTIVRDPSAPVIHAHRRSFLYEFRRGILDAWVLDEAFGYRYRLADKLNRARVAGSAKGMPRPSFSARCSALKTYSAHVLARSFYGGCRIFKPLGGEALLGRVTAGI